MNEIKRDDLHQLITYMHILPAKKGGLIYPYDLPTDKLFVPSDNPKELYGNGGIINTFGVPIPQYPKDYLDFINHMKKKL